MTTPAPVPGLIGGAMIGLASVFLMLAIGRIAGISGILLNALAAKGAAAKAWRLSFVLGLPLGALCVTALGLKDWTSVVFPTSVPLTAAAGLIVGIGTTLGSGCTSGHGICGIARLSMRSVVATVIFVAAAAITVFITRHVI